MREFIQYVRNCSGCQHLTYNHNIEGVVCGNGGLRDDYSLKEGRKLYKQNAVQLTTSCPMYAQSVEVEG